MREKRGGCYAKDSQRSGTEGGGEMELALRAISPYGTAELERPGLFVCDPPFTHVWNLRAETGVLSLQDMTVPRTPLSLVLDEGSFRRLSRSAAAGVRFQTGGGTLNGAGLTITTRGAERFSCQMTAADQPHGGSPCARLWGAAVLFAGPGSLAFAAASDGSVWADGERTPTQDRAAGILERGRPEELVGLGEGLTPAGDDFLIGVLAALEWMGADGPRRRLTQALAGRLDGTTTLSRAFLARAMEGEYSQPVLDLFRALEDPAATAQATARLCAIGHSSGSDMLGGILWAMDRYMT